MKQFKTYIAKGVHWAQIVPLREGIEKVNKSPTEYFHYMLDQCECTFPLSCFDFHVYGSTHPNHKIYDVTMLEDGDCFDIKFVSTFNECYGIVGEEIDELFKFDISSVPFKCKFNEELDLFKVLPADFVGDFFYTYSEKCNTQSLEICNLIEKYRDEYQDVIIRECDNFIKEDSIKCSFDILFTRNIPIAEEFTDVKDFLLMPCRFATKKLNPIISEDGRTIYTNLGRIILEKALISTLPIEGFSISKIDDQYYLNLYSWCIE